MAVDVGYSSQWANYLPKNKDQSHSLGYGGSCRQRQQRPQQRLPRKRIAPSGFFGEMRWIEEEPVRRPPVPTPAPTPSKPLPRRRPPLVLQSALSMIDEAPELEREQQHARASQLRVQSEHRARHSAHDHAAEYALGRHRLGPALDVGSSRPALSLPSRRASLTALAADTTPPPRQAFDIQRPMFVQSGQNTQAPRSGPEPLRHYTRPAAGSPKLKRRNAGPELVTDDRERADRTAQTGRVLVYGDAYRDTAPPPPADQDSAYGGAELGYQNEDENWSRSAESLHSLDSFASAVSSLSTDDSTESVDSLDSEDFLTPKAQVTPLLSRVPSPSFTTSPALSVEGSSGSESESELELRTPASQQSRASLATLADKSGDAAGHYFGYYLEERGELGGLWSQNLLDKLDELEV